MSSTHRIRTLILPHKARRDQTRDGLSVWARKRYGCDHPARAGDPSQDRLLPRVACDISRTGPFPILLNRALLSWPLSKFTMDRVACNSLS